MIKKIIMKHEGDMWYQGVDHRADAKWWFERDLIKTINGCKLLHISNIKRTGNKSYEMEVEFDSSVKCSDEENWKTYELEQVANQI